MVLASFGQHHHGAQDLVMVWQVAEQQATDAEQHRNRTSMVIMAALHLEEDTVVTVNLVVHSTCPSTTRHKMRCAVIFTVRHGPVCLTLFDSVYNILFALPILCPVLYFSGYRQAALLSDR